MLGIDEIYLLGKPRTIFSNIDKRTILEIHPNRHRKELANFIEGLKDRHSIQVVCQDMYQDYRRLTRGSLSWAVLVVDKFHVVRMANNAIDKARLKLETTTADRRKLRSSRRLFLAREHKQGDRNKAEMQEWFQKYPDLEEAYRLKELFYKIFDNDIKNRSPQQASDMYSEWYCQLNEKQKDNFSEITKAISNWKDDILNYFSRRHTSGYVEALNRLVGDMEVSGAAATSGGS